jgi:peptidoglycan L-alanyl-D-glutamate endopeptidase CwlK
MENYFASLIATGNLSGLYADIARHLSRVFLYGYSGAAALHPEVQTRAKSFVDIAGNAGYGVSIINTIRTYAYQNDLYLKGRSTEGPIVTNAPALESYHNYGLAFDVACSKKDGSAMTESDWQNLASLGEQAQLVAGFSFGDNDHFEYHPGFSWSDIIGFFKFPE